MRLTRFWFGLLLWSGVWAHAQSNPAAPLALPAQPPVNPGGPRIVFENPVHDFGKVRSGEVVKFDYAFTNAGTETLEIVAVQPACGCTTTGDWTRKVEPGKTGTIPIQFNSLSIVGPVFKTVTVVSNDKINPNTILQLKGNIWRPIDVLPQFAVLNIPPDSPEASAVVRIINNMEEPVSILPPEITNRAFKAELRTNTPGKEFQLILSSVPPLAPGNLQSTLTLKTTSTNVPAVTVNVWANIQPQILVMPPQITLPAGPLPNAVSPTITLQNNSTNPFAITGPDLRLADVKADLRETQPGRQFQATIHFPQGYELPPGQPAAMTFKSDNPKLPVITVPIAQMPRQVLTPVPHTSAASPAVPGKPVLH